MKNQYSERIAYFDKNLRHNFFVNVMDGGFFGFAMGFASFSTILPLFVSQMTNSGLLIGLVPGLHVLGWQLPQLLTAKKISGLDRLTPFVLRMTIHERLPFLGLMLTAWFLPILGNKIGLAITFLLLTWQGLGSGLTANAWQNLMAKVIPAENRATFFGSQSALSNLLASVGAVIAGFLLEKLAPRNGYALCFLLAFILMVISFIFIKQNREIDQAVESENASQIQLTGTIKKILRNDSNFLWFLIARSLTQFGLMGTAFYMVYAVNVHEMTKLTAGFMTGILLLTQVTSSLVMGRLADRWSKKALLEIGSVAGFLSAITAAAAPNLSWFVLIFIMAGLANTAFWTIGLAFTIEFGEESEKPTYIGLANTLAAPSSLFAPVLGGWLVDSSGYATTFILAAGISILTALIYHFFVNDKSPSM